MVSAGAEDLPNELVCTICSYLPAVDVVHFLSTCKTLHAFMAEETIWRNLCAAYGVHDPTELNGRTFFDVYSGLLHVYGPLLGLWASDAPYLGCILEFRLDAGVKGILGERWCTGTRSPFQAPPVLPTYHGLLSISLPSARLNAQLRASRQDEVDIQWSSEETDHETGVAETVLRPLIESDGTPTLTLKVLSPTDASSYVLSNTSHSVLPDFPSDSFAAWYDPSRELPRLPLEPSPAVYAGSLDEAVGFFKDPDWDDEIGGPNPTASAMITAKGRHIKPAALHIHHRSLVGVEGRDSRFPGPFLGSAWLAFVSNLNVHKPSPFNARLYPLRSEYRVGQDPADQHWDPASLEGLWLGSYGIHGTEVLWFSYDAGESVITALKLTGDYNVPRGAASFAIDLKEKIDMTQQVQPDGYIGIPLHRVYRSQGIVSAFGFALVTSYHIPFARADPSIVTKTERWFKMWRSLLVLMKLE